jgi:hypothetical protein
MSSASPAPEPTRLGQCFRNLADNRRDLAPKSICKAWVLWRSSLKSRGELVSCEKSSSVIHQTWLWLVGSGRRGVGQIRSDLRNSPAMSMFAEVGHSSRNYTISSRPGKATVGAEAALQVTTSTTTLAAIGTRFNPYTGTTNLTYKIRTMQATRPRSVTLKVTSDFIPANGLPVATPPAAGDALTCPAPPLHKPPAVWHH